MRKVNDFCWAAGTDPEKVREQKLGEKQNLPYSKTLEKRKITPLPIRIKRGDHRIRSD